MKGTNHQYLLFKELVVQLGEAMGFQSWWISESSILLLQLLVRPRADAGMETSMIIMITWMADRYIIADAAREMFGHSHVCSLIRLILCYYMLLYVIIIRFLYPRSQDVACKPDSLMMRASIPSSSPSKFQARCEIFATIALAGCLPLM